MKKILLLLIVLALFSSPTLAAEKSEYDLGVKAYVSQRYVEAAEHLKNYVEVSPEAKAYYMLGYAVYALERAGSKEFGNSSKYFGQAYLIDPKFDPQSVGFEVK